MEDELLPDDGDTVEEELAELAASSRCLCTIIFFIPHSRRVIDSITVHR